MTKSKEFWWKEVGENFRAGLFKKDEGNGKKLWELYVKQMTKSLEITFDSAVVKEAKKLGAEEIKVK